MSILASSLLSTYSQTACALSIRRRALFNRTIKHRHSEVSNHNQLYNSNQINQTYDTNHNMAVSLDNQPQTLKVRSNQHLTQTIKHEANTPQALVATSEPETKGPTGYQGPPIGYAARIIFHIHTCLSRCKSVQPVGDVTNESLPRQWTLCGKCEKGVCDQ